MKPTFSQQLEQELPHLWRFAWRLSYMQDIAEDLVQRTALRALEKRHQFQEGSNLRSWTFRIMHSIWKNELRSRAIRQEVSFSPVHEEVAPDGTINQQLLREVLVSVNALPEAQRLVMLLICVEGYSYNETADILDIPLGTVMSRLARARLTVGQRFSSQQTSVVTEATQTTDIKTARMKGTHHEH